MTEPEMTIDWIGGVCPVQAEGVINGKPFYFRARGDRWSLTIGADEWVYDERYGTWPDAGWMSIDEALVFLHKAARLYAGAPCRMLKNDFQGSHHEDPLHNTAGRRSEARETEAIQDLG